MLVGCLVIEAETWPALNSRALAELRLRCLAELAGSLVPDGSPAADDLVLRSTPSSGISCSEVFEKEFCFFIRLFLGWLLP